MSCLCQHDKRHVLCHAGPLLISRTQFCGAFFHAKWCYEWDVKETLCLVDRQCYRTVVFLVARLSEPGKNHPYVARYMNCYRGRTDLNCHAEEFMLQDPTIQAATQGTLELFLTYQPCHLSGGSKHVTQHPISCTLRLVEFQRNHPALRITVVPTAIYRAQYTDPSGFRTQQQAAVFLQRVQLARDGLALLVAHGIRLRGPERTDWDFLIGLTHECGPITEQQWMARRRNDEAIGKFLGTFSQGG